MTIDPNVNSRRSIVGGNFRGLNCRGTDNTNALNGIKQVI